MKDTSGKQESRIVGKGNFPSPTIYCLLPTDILPTVKIGGKRYEDEINKERRCRKKLVGC